jgi:hypothetical protein
MITFLRSVQVLPGKTPDAMAFAKEIAAQVKAATGQELTVGVPVGGDASRIGWYTRYDSMGTMETQQTKLLADPKSWEIAGRAAHLFVPGSLRDDIWRTI